MVGIEKLNRLKENSQFFDFDKKEFDRLINTDINIMGLMDNRVYKISPLLMQITSYAYGDGLYHDLEAMNYNENGNFFDTPIGEVMDTCCEYVMDLSCNGCNHPTILIYNNLLNGSCAYNDMVDNMSYALEYADENLQYDITDFISNVDDKILKYKEDINDIIYSELSKVKDWKDLLKLFGKYGKTSLKADMFALENYNSYCIGNFWVKYYNMNKITGDSYFTQELHKIMKIIYDKLENDDYMDDDLFELLSDIYETYTSYKQIQLYYLKNDYKESKIYEKCHKM